MSHDPIDSLIYLREGAAGALEALMEAMQQVYGFEDESEAMSDFVAWSESIRRTITDEVALHDDGRREYSTGVPFSRPCKYRTTEPDEDGNEIPVVGELHVIMHPDGSPTTPPNNGMWAA
ncbi:hypothetical protein [Corynebacterium flavescens]|uniref:hypothetical protein n=1 Tax=Corynebacterium flavescens TaxID=28028 RepID=UPI003FD2F82E